jgi:hypothetical protein
VSKDDFILRLQLTAGERACIAAQPPTHCQPQCKKNVLVASG